MKLTEAQLAHLILAFHEGTLSADEKQQLENHILEHPEISEDLEHYPTLSLSNESYNGPSLVQSQLENLAVYQSEVGHPYDKMAIGQVENILTASEEKIETLLQNEQHYLEVKNKVQLTVLKPNLQVAYPRTEQLIKKIPLRKLNSKIYFYAASAAAAVLIAVMLVSQNASAPADIEPIQKGVASKKSVVQQTNGKNMATTFKSSPLKNPYQTLAHIQEEVLQEPRDYIMPLQEQSIFTEVYAHNGIENRSNHDLSALNSSAEQLGANAEPQAQNSQSAFTKEPITVKAFLLQKTNKKLFGTAAPSTDVRYETMARYASETIGLPVRYEVEQGSQHDKILFQIGPISIERTRSKK